MQSESEGIKKLSTGSLVLSAAAIVMIIAPIILHQAVPSSLSSFSNITSITIVRNTASSSAPAFQSHLSTIISVLEISILLLILSYIIMAVGNFYLSSGVSALARSGRKVGTAGAGAMMSIIALVLLIVGTLLSDGPIISAFNSNNFTATLRANIGTVLGGLAVEAIGILMLIIGNVLLGIGLYRVGDTYNKSSIKIGGILVFIATILTVPLALAGHNIFLAVPILFYVSFILTYLGLRKISLGSAFPSISSVTPIQPLGQSASPQIYQVGQGEIRGNGSAFIDLHTSTPAIITSVKVDGTTLRAVTINPIILQPGDNAIVIKFDNVYSLIPGAFYFITISLNLGGSLVEVKAIATYYP